MIICHKCVVQSSAILESSEGGNVPSERGRSGQSKPASPYRAGLTLTQAMRQHCPTTALGLLACSGRRFISSCLHPTRADPREGEEVFCCGCSTKGWLWELGSWRRRLGGAGFPAIVGEIFLLCFSHKCLAVAEAVGAATGLLGQCRGLLPVPAWCRCFPRVGAVPVSAAMLPAEDAGRDPAVGMRLGASLGLEHMHMCTLAIASNLGSIL